jgi:uncharacterized membrane protein
VRPPRVQTALVLALALAAPACQKTAAVDCPATPALVCPEAGAPSFTDVYNNVIHPLCDRCHTPGGQEAVMPLLNYQQVYGKGGAEVIEIRNQVESCLMPPPGQPEVLTDDERQLLLAWIACGAPNDSPALDAGAGD